MRLRKKKPSRPVELTVEGSAVPRERFPSGRIRFSVGASGREGESRRRELRKLVTWRAWDILKAIEDGRVDTGNAAAQIKEYGEAALVNLRAQFLQGVAPSLSDEQDGYLDWYARNRKDRSYDATKSRLKRFMEQTREDGTALGSIPLDRLTRADIERGLADISAKPGTQNSVHAAVSGLYSWSIEQEAELARMEVRPPRWTVNAASAVEERETHARTVTAAQSQIVALLATAEVYQRAYLRAFVHLGFRKDELVHTRLHLDLDLTDWRWKIQPRGPDDRCGCRACRGKGWTPKVGRSHRTIEVPAVPKGLRAAILEYLEAYPCEPGDFAFRNPRTNRVWHGSNLLDDFKGLCNRADVRYGRDTGLVLHDLRGTCATELDKAGVSLKVIATLLGDSAETIMNNYLRVKAAEVSDGIRRGPSYSPED